jgi:hypothetical protein
MTSAPGRDIIFSTVFLSASQTQGSPRNLHLQKKHDFGIKTFFEKSEKLQKNNQSSVIIIIWQKKLTSVPDHI